MHQACPKAGSATTGLPTGLGIGPRAGAAAVEPALPDTINVPVRLLQSPFAMRGDNLAIFPDVLDRGTVLVPDRRSIGNIKLELRGVIVAGRGYLQLNRRWADSRSVLVITPIT